MEDLMGEKLGNKLVDSMAVNLVLTMELMLAGQRVCLKVGC